MKRTIVAILALSPVLAFAQTKSPAQPSSTPALQSTLIAAASFPAATSADRAANPTALRVSTGVTAPRIIHTANLAAGSSRNRHLVATDQHISLEMIVDETGKPTSLAIVKSAGEMLDKDVLATVSLYRYQPGMLDGQPTPGPVKLEVVIPAGTTY